MLRALQLLQVFEYFPIILVYVFVLIKEVDSLAALRAARWAVPAVAQLAARVLILYLVRVILPSSCISIILSPRLTISTFSRSAGSTQESTVSFTSAYTYYNKLESWLRSWLRTARARGSGVNFFCASVVFKSTSLNSCHVRSTGRHSAPTG